MGEPQKDLGNMFYVAPEDTYGIRMADIETTELRDQPVGEHQQGGLVKMRDQKEQKILVAKLTQHTAFRVSEKRLMGFAYHREIVAVGYQPRVAELMLPRLLPVAIVAIASLEILQELL